MDQIAYNNRQSDWRQDLLVRIRPHEVVLDVGRSTRAWFELARVSKPAQRQALRP